MKRVLLSLVLIVLVIGVALAGCAQPAPTPTPTPAPAPSSTPTPISPQTPTPVKPVELKFATWLPPVHHLVKNIMNPWAAEVEQRTGGRVKVRIFTAEALGKQNDHLQMLLDGIADVATCQNRYSDLETFLLSDVFGVPWLIADEYTDETGTSKAIREMVYDKYLTPIFLKDVKVLWTSRYSGRVLHTTKKPVRKLEDVKGLLVGTAGEWDIRSYQLYGASVENLFAPEVYTALERGMVDGTEYPLSFLVGFNLKELVKYVTVLNVGSAAYFFAMSLPTWNELSPADQKIIDELSVKYADLDAASWMEETTIALQVGQEAGIEFIYLSPQERQRWADVCKDLPSEFAAAVDAKGLPASQMLEDIMKLLPK